MHQMRSDNGSNFIGARELKEVLAEMNQNQVKQEMLKESSDWFEVKLNVPKEGNSRLPGCFAAKINRFSTSDRPQSVQKRVF